MSSPCHQIVYSGAPSLSKKEIKDFLENGTDEEKYAALKAVILLHMDGDDQTKLLMTVIKYVLSSTYKPLKKLLLYFWENIEKVGDDGQLIPQMILVCSHVRNDLTHPNEYVVGSTLRFLCKVHEREILEPLVSVIVQNLEHRNAYVRRQAVMAIYSIASRPALKNLIPEATDIIFDFLQTESDPASKRNAFILLQECAPDKASKYLRSIIDDVNKAGHLFQLELLRLLKSLCVKYPQEKIKYLRVIASLMNSKNSAVLYQCATTLSTLSKSEIAIRSAADSFINLLTSESDANVRMIVLDQLLNLQKRFPTIMEKMVMDLSRGLQSPDLSIKTKILNSTKLLLSNRNVSDILTILKKEFLESKKSLVNLEAHGEYRKNIVTVFHEAAVKYPSIASDVIDVVCDHVNDLSGYEISLLLREAILTNPDLRVNIIPKLSQNFSSITDSHVYRMIMWILGDFSEGPEIISSYQAIVESLREILIHANTEEQEPVEQHDDVSLSSMGTTETTSRTHATIVRDDGTYGTQTTDIIEQKKKGVEKDQTVRGFILEGDYFLASVVASTLTKLGLAYGKLDTVEETEKRKLNAEIMMVLCALIRLGTNPEATKKMDKDTESRIKLCLQTVLAPSPKLTAVFLEKSKEAFTTIIKEEKRIQSAEEEKQLQEQKVASQVDAVINISHLQSTKYDAFSYEDDDETVVDSNPASSKRSNLHNVIQLTGFSDPVYAEAVVTMHHYDIILDVLVVNQRNTTLQNLSLELATMGDLKLCDRPQSYTLAPLGRQHIRSSIKVSSTDTGIIFGNILFDITGSGTQTSCVILNDVHIDIMDYIQPARCSDIKYRSMWLELGWENKISVECTVKGVTMRQFLDMIQNCTRMERLTAESALSGDCEFLSANLYAKSVFGEDAQANISLEKKKDGKIIGLVRIRSVTQGIAFAIGDTITKTQAAFNKKQKKNE